MFDVIDTEKYIGIVLEFAGGKYYPDHCFAVADDVSQAESSLIIFSPVDT